MRRRWQVKNLTVGATIEQRATPSPGEFPMLSFKIATTTSGSLCVPMEK
jgi:hypothetical protein